ncbi:hypothetical protein J7400_15560 [Shimia sp. R9_2]|uniref:TnsA endonuclease N-terminal domain-containing protein n=1 Tax=Shimia sp. R9_2 TaxID=2821112 RepID=UPI001ADBA65C|nr:TnsA endonuclease N-terminal domain-containing protein [Shimia sp. R9_2]MBO9398105.1 hypothetical protein [Shimia sp. R9_2]
MYFLYLANHDVRDIWEQPTAVRYIDAAGRSQVHFPDCLLKLGNGRRLLLAIKPWKKVIESGFLCELRQIRAALRKDFADDLVLVTDRDFTRDEALNAQRYLEFSRSRNAAHQNKLLSIVESLCSPITLGSLSQMLDLEGDGFRAIVIAIYEKVLIADKTQLLGTESIVARGGMI